MQRLRPALLIGSLFLYPLLVHLFLLKDAPVYALVALLVMSLVMLWVNGRRWRGSLLYALLAAGAVAGLASGRAYALYAPPLVFNLSLAALFAVSLKPGRVPLIERFMRRQRGTNDLPAALVVFARQLTWVWIGFFVSMAAVALALALFASLEAWSLFANIVNYLLVVALFFLQFAYGHWRLRHYGISPAWNVLRQLPGDWLRAGGKGA